ncbi:hypothetical protein F2Q70_00018103 [Brassica cretica]|uniref:Uncharacterized protein n=1 Tax=Brassica cretica TaxID=69181 RepID=A0A8S9KNJ0_BRACR|nr:hypothetical protein F2Q70_00018103 [Brassica cretica]KAF2595602.1 hypothetical protein F2Q68_00011117 [Brassica cretica]
MDRFASDKKTQHDEGHRFAHNKCPWEVKQLHNTSSFNVEEKSFCLVQKTRRRQGGWWVPLFDDWVGNILRATTCLIVPPRESSHWLATSEKLLWCPITIHFTTFYINSHSTKLSYKLVSSV